MTQVSLCQSQSKLHSVHTQTKGGAWQERGDGVLEGAWYPNAHYEISENDLTHVLIQPSVIASNWCVRGNKWNCFKTMC